MFRLQIITAFFILLVFLSLTIASSLTNRPQIDEGMFASPALNLATNGFFGTTVLETEKSPLTRIERRTYWVMPLFLLNVSLSFKIFGLSIFSMRLVSIFWGLILLAAWYFIVLKLSRNQNIALLCLALLACNYTVLETASLGRMDIMSASLGFAALAAYLLLRERNLLLAVFVCECFVVASGLTHPNGIMAFFGSIFLILYFDFRRLDWRHFAAASVPFLVGGIAYGSYVLQDPMAFRAQFIDNAAMGGRMKGFSSPFGGFVREFTERYPHAYGLGLNSAGHAGPIYLKSLILIGYIVGFFGVLFNKNLRRNYAILLVLTAIYFVVLSLLDGQKETPYLIHIIPFYIALLAIWIHWIWQKSSGRLLKVGLAVAVVFLLALQTGGMLLRVRQNTYANFYEPAVNFLKQNAGANEVIMGGAGLGFGLNFPANFISDGSFGYNTGKRPKFIVYDGEAQLSWAQSKEFFPDFYEYLPKLLSEQYNLVYENADYKIYARR